MNFQVVLTVMNNVIAPCVATLIVSPNCLHYLFTNSPYINTVFKWPSCGTYDVDAIRFNTSEAICIGHDLMTSINTYEPPFQYQFQV